jgi:glucose/arabinose dehydrogenase
MELAPDGRLFVCLQAGQVRVIKNFSLLATPFLTLTVDSNGERGLLGIAFDPNFASNNFVYVYYTVPGSPAHNRVSRFTANGDVAVSGSELVLADLDNLSVATNHNGGAIHFGPDGKLYIAVGENADPPNSQTLSNRLGKILRISNDGSIPADNPFFNTATGLNRSIWALGLRNPFTFAFQPGTGRMFINDVGEVTWEEINEGVAGSNYGWNICEGVCSPANPSYRDPLFQYAHGSTSTTPCAITGGVFYNPATVQFPQGYVGKYFFADICAGWIHLFDPVTSTAADFASGISLPVDLKTGTDGSLYYLSYSPPAVFRIQYPAAYPAVVTPPADQTVMQGQLASFNISATGNETLSYQWQRNQVNIAGATSSSYSVASAMFADNGARFRCIVTNSLGSATSNEATLTVNAPPSVVTPLSDQTVTQGQPVTFVISATGSPTLSFQWQRNQVNIVGATSSSYNLSSTTFADSGARFRCVVSNSFGTATSNEVILTVNSPPSIDSNPANQTVTEGQPATFSIIAAGSPTLAYQWQRNQVDISGATSSTYAIAATTASDNGAGFRCVVTNAFGNVTSKEAILTVQPPPPALVTEENSNIAIALDSVTLFRDPFRLTNPFNLSSDNRTRVMLFATNLTLGPAEDASSVTARAEDAQLNVYPLTVEYAGSLPGLSQITEVVVVLPSNLPEGQSVLVGLTWHSQISNKARIRIQ